MIIKQGEIVLKVNMWRNALRFSALRARLPMLRHILHFSLIIAASAVTAQPEIPPGQYVRDRDSGTLIVRVDKHNRRTFEIESIGANCHSCGVSGVIRGSIGHAGEWTADGSEPKCIISFSVDGSKVVVNPTTFEACRGYCGMRAGFDGSYALPTAACTQAGQKATRDRSLALYRSHHYSQAAGMLQTLIAQCKEFMNWIEIDQVRNDLALSQYHNGEIPQCLETLGATLAAEVKDEEELKAGGANFYLPPCDFENYIGVAKATWFNKALCNKAMAKER